MTIEPGALLMPDLVLLESVSGDFNRYLDLVYNYFKEDFVTSRPVYRGKRVGLKCIPFYAGKEATFWHLTSEGSDEKNRNPDIRRMERIRWPRPIMETSEHPTLKVWRNKRKSDERILLWHEAEQYLVVLADRGDYILPWTAYLVTEAHQEKKLRLEYEAFIKAEAAQHG